MLMNSAPAELLQLLTIAALQPSSPRSLRRQKSVLPGRCPHLVCTNHEKKKPPCLNRIRQCGFVFAVRSGAYLCESSSYFDLFFCRISRENSAHSRFDNFNHVKYTKTLLVRNWRTHYFASFFQIDVARCAPREAVCASRTREHASRAWSGWRKQGANSASRWAFRRWEGPPAGAHLIA